MVKYVKQEVSHNFSNFHGKGVLDCSLLGSDTK